VVAGEQHLTYQELNTRANRLARALQSLGVGPEVLVGVCLERSLELLVALLAIHKAGGAYVPLDPEYPAQRLSYMIEDARLSLLLSHSSLQSKLPIAANTCYFIDQQADIWTQEADGNLPGSLDMEQLAYMIYTSGSTGKPKGAMNTHCAISNRLRWMQDSYQLGGHDRVLQKTPISFDVSVWELFWALLTGARIVMAQPGGHRDPGYLKQVITEQAITTVHFVPTMLHAFLQEPLVDQCDSLRRVFRSGEALSTDLQHRFFASLTEQSQLINLYGPTEAAVDVTAWVCQPDEPGETVPLGRPISNIQIYLLDREQQLVPIGVAGELHIGGGGLARGYLRRADLTAERFIPDPFSHQPGARLYKTGDLARYRADGTIEYLGRIDFQVKLRGFRIELGEIEACLREQAGVQDAVVVMYGGAGEHQFLLAYLVPTAGATVRISEIEAGLDARLPNYMVPHTYMLLASLPVTPNGKLDRRALPSPDQQAVLHHQEQFEAPSTPTQEGIARIWCDLLRLPQIGIHDNFFALGGHSLLATRLQSRIRQTFAVEMSVRSLFESPTIALLAQYVEQLQQETRQERLPALLPVPRDTLLPLSFAQERLWFLHQLDPLNTAYHMFNALRLHGPLRINALAQSLRALFLRHEVLHTTFVQQDTTPVQAIAPEGLAQIPVIDLQHIDPLLQERMLNQFVEQHAQQSFALATGPLLRFAVLRLAEQEHVLLINMHHAISDGWSIGVMVHDLTAFYNAAVAEHSVQLPALPLQYADYAAWQRSWLQSHVLQEQLEYWRAQLADMPPTIHLPLDRLRHSIYNQHNHSHTVLLSHEQAQQLKGVSQQHDVTLFMTLLATLQTVLFRWSGQDDIAIGTVTAGRTHEEIEALIGCFLNLLVIRAHLAPELRWEQLVSALKTTVLEAYMHQDVPFEKIVEELKPDRTQYHNAFYNVAFLLQNMPEEALQADGLTFESLPLPPRDALLDLCFVAQETPDGLELICEYDTALFHADTIRVLMDAYQQALQQIIVDASTSLDAFALPAALVEQAQRARRREQKQMLAIAATFTAEPLEAPLSYWMRELELPTTITFAAYNQVLQQLLDPQSLFATNTRGMNLLLLRVEDWLRFTPASDLSSALIDQTMHEFVQALQQFVRRGSVPCLLCLCPPLPQTQADTFLASWCQRAEQRLTQEVEQLHGVTLLSSSELFDRYPVEDYYDEYTDKAGHIPFTPHFFTALGTLIARKIAARTFLPYKVIVVDCDQTLWQGVCGEDGPHGVVIDPARRTLQEFLVAQQQAGMLICLCSKNSEEDVFAVFAAHPEMPLRREHLAQVRINWQPKSQNMRELAQALHLSLDSMIFIDDNPLEQAEVQAQCPGVLLFPFPPEIEQLPRLLAHFWAFDQAARSAEDMQRTRYYQQEQERQRLQTTLSFADFLRHLNVQVHVLPLEASSLARAAQMTQRTNQFNMTTIRRSEQEIMQFSREEQHEILLFRVEDRYGEYGIVGLVLYTSEQSTLRVDTFLLSCRVLGRGVEHQIIAYLGQRARERGLATVTVPYLPTAKNQPAADFLVQTGAMFKQEQPQGWQVVYPAAFAAELRFTAQVEQQRTEPSASESQESSMPTISTATGEHLAQAQLVKIATTLHSVERISSLIQAQQPRRTVQGVGHAQPTTVVEAELLKIWSELLNLVDFGTTDNFFALGGHSLLATQMLSQIRAIFQVELPLQSIFEHPTIGAMALLIEQQQQAFLSQADDDQLAQMLLTMGGASDDDLLALLDDSDSL
jgi:amino acid adenylation domain-containing protein/FkbH-like protein